MPNWVMNIVEITGDKGHLHKVMKQLGRKYSITAYDFISCEEREVEVDEPFSFWNIVVPTNLDEYHKKDEFLARKAEKEFRDLMLNSGAGDLATPAPSPNEIVEQVAEALNSPTMPDFTQIIEEFDEAVRTKNDWYNWNLRNWGTKWDACDPARRIDEPNNKVVYTYQTAWSPAVSALDSLAEQYPTLTITTRFIEESDAYAGEICWREGKKFYEVNLEPTHSLNEEWYGECYACSDENAGDPDYDEMRARYHCDTIALAGLEIDEELGDEPEEWE